MSEVSLYPPIDSSVVDAGLAMGARFDETGECPP